MEKASSAEDLLQMCLAALESESGGAGVRERLGLPPQDDDSNGKKKDVGAVQKALLQVCCCCAAGAQHQTGKAVALALCDVDWHVLSLPAQLMAATFL